jgi:hypothetical protein
MTEPDVALTDYLLALEATVFAVLVWRGDVSEHLRLPFTIFFGATAVAAAAGGTVHGFFATGSSMLGVALWRLTLVALGVTALAAWMIGARMLLPEEPAYRVQVLAGILVSVYTVVVAAFYDRFWIAIIHYLPPTLLMLAAFLVATFASGSPSAFAGLVGMVLTLVGAVVQQQKIALHPVYFNHNALYHAIQAVALWLIFVGSASGHASPQAR